MDDRVDERRGELREAVELLSRLISIPRVSRQETEAADMLEAQMQEWGIEVQRTGNNLWEVAPHFDEALPTLLLNAHIDTVKPVSAWTRDPHNPLLTPEGVLYGLGSNDDGASLVTLLLTYRRLRAAERDYNLVFVASAEEEVSGAGGIASVLPLLPRIDVALVGEPTCMHPAIAEKGLMVLDVTEHGKAGHAARNEGDNALYHAVDDIAWFRSYAFPKQTDLLGPVKMTVTIIQAGTQHNVIPDECVFTVDVRSNECYSNQDIYAQVCASVKGEVKARSFRLNSSRIALDHPLTQRALQLGRKPFGSPTLSDQALMPFPSMKMGPGDSSRSHTADEYVREDELLEALYLYDQLLTGLQL